MGTKLATAIDLIRAFSIRRGEPRRAESGTREALLALQRDRLARLLQHAWSSSPFYRRRWGERCPRPEDLASLEPLTKSELIRSYDDVLADRSLSRSTLQAMLGTKARCSHIVIATSGTTGEPLVVPYSRSEWLQGLAYCLRAERRRSGSFLQGIRANLRMAAIMTHNPIHASTHLNASFRVPPLRQLLLAASMPVAQQIEALERFQPTTVSGYPSAIDLLARAQLEGALSIRPQRALVGGETLPDGMRERVKAAWNAELFDCYGLTECLVFAHECREHRGLHVDEDAVLLEVVDEQNRLLPEGKVGSGVLLTSLYNYTLPILRYHVGDLLCVDASPCPCGAPFARMVGVEGRRDEILQLKAQRGGTVDVHPTAFESPLEATALVRKFQIRQRDGALQVLVVLGAGAEGELEKLSAALRDVAREHGVAEGSICVEAVSTLEQERGLTDKRRRVVRG